MSLQRRLLLYLLVCAPVVWGVALLVSADRARHEVNELFDTEIIRLALQVQATLVAAGRAGPDAADTSRRPRARPTCATWPSRCGTAQGQLLLVDREGVQLPRRADATGFVDMQLGGEPWRVYYLQSQNGDWLVAAGQRGDERDELVRDLVGSQLLPWLLVLPVLLLAMAWAVRRALQPVRLLTAELQGRSADDLRPVPVDHAPQELQPMLAAMNGLFTRIESDAGARAPLHRRRGPRAAHAAGRAARAVGRAAPRDRRRRAPPRRDAARRRHGPHGPAGDAAAGAVAPGVHRPPARRRRALQWHAAGRAGDQRRAAAGRAPPHRARLRMAGRRARRRCRCRATPT